MGPAGGLRPEGTLVSRINLVTRLREKVQRDVVPRIVAASTARYFSATSDPATLIRTSGNAQEPRLADLFAHYGSDKGWSGDTKPPFSWPPHNYAFVYELLFRSRRNRTTSIVECGIGTNNTDVRSNMTAHGRPGASLRAWRDYFPNATVIGLDIDERVLFSEERIRTFHVDQTDPVSVGRFWSTSGLEVCDIIIDDGLHTFDAGIAFFEASFDRLADDGIYIIEDVSPSRLNSYRDFFARRDEVLDFFQIYRPGVALRSNCLVVIRRPN